jgi:hypothetical protein
VLPLFVGELVKDGVVGNPDVVHEHIDGPERLLDFCDHPLRPPGLTEVGGHVHALPDPRRSPAPARHHAGRLLGEEPRGLEPDAGRGAGDNADPVAQAKIHAAASVPP